MFFRMTYDFASRSDYSEAGMLIVKNGSTSNYTGSKSVAKSLDEDAKILKWKDYTSTTLTIKMASIPETAYSNETCVVGYILVNGIYYYSNPRSFSVISLLNIYAGSTAKILCNKDDGTTELISVASLANAFLSEIEDN